MRKKTLQNLFNETNEKLNSVLWENTQLREKLTNANTKIEFLEAADKPLEEEVLKLRQENENLASKVEEADNKSDSNIAELEERINQLLADNNSLKGELYESKKRCDDLIVRLASYESTDNEHIETIIMPAPPEVHKPISADKKDPVAFDYASTIISKIVLKTATLKNSVTTSGDENSAELITLALGKAEMLKTDILQTVLADLPTEQKISKMDSIYNDTQEYFNSLEGQVSK